MIVMGTSLGGTRALHQIFSGLPENFPSPIAVVVHRHREDGDFLVEFLQKDCPLPLTEVVDKDPIASGRIYLAPANYHLMVEKDHFSLSVDELVQFARPSIDVLFESAADIFGAGTIGVILTGANHDGADGARSIRKRGGTMIVEDPQSAFCPTMPAAAIEACAPGYICPVKEIAALLVHLTSEENWKK